MVDTCHCGCPASLEYPLCVRYSLILSLPLRIQKDDIGQPPGHWGRCVTCRVMGLPHLLPAKAAHSWGRG